MASTKNTLFLDFETRSRQNLDGGSFKYAQDPSTDILITGYCYEDEPAVCFDMVKELQCRKEFYDIYMQAENLVAHNFLFEIPVIGYQGYRYNWPALELDKWRCTMQMAGRAGLPLALEYAAEALGLEELKIGYGRLLIQRFSIPQQSGRFNEMDSDPKGKQQFMDYCAQDAIVSREIWRNCQDWTPREVTDVRYDLRNNLRGVPIDVLACEIIHDQVKVEVSHYGSILDDVTKGQITKVTQVQRIKQWVKCHVNDQIPSCDAAHIIDILAGVWGEVDDSTKIILEARQYGGKSSTSKYVKYLDCHIDGKIYGMQISFGAHTGRAISKLLNLYNLPKPSVEYDSMDELVEQLITKNHDQYVKAASSAIRGMIVAPKDKILAVSDYAAIEARIVFWLAGCTSGVRKFASGADIYVDMAGHIYTIPNSRVGEEERWLGKQAVLGCGYGLGSQGFVNSCLRWSVEIPLSLAEEAVGAYRDTYPEVVEYWNILEDAAMRACRTGKMQVAGRIKFKTMRTRSGKINLMMKLPSDRCITYPDVKIVMATTPWGAKKKSVSYKKASERGFYRETTYGGKLMENACQGIARDIMYYGGQCAAKEGYMTLFTVYDEIISITDEPGEIERFNELICQKEEWANGLPLKAEGKLLRRYEKL
jgi:DNA polymerase